MQFLNRARGEGEALAAEKGSTVISNEKRNSVSTTTFTHTTHMVHVDLADLLSGYDLSDDVVLMIETPSGRAKRVRITGNFLVSQHHADSVDTWN